MLVVAGPMLLVTGLVASLVMGLITDLITGLNRESNHGPYVVLG